MKPTDFFVGVLDFFAALLPGAIATWLLLAYVDPRDFSHGGVRLDGEVAGGLAYLLVSYILGHFAFAVGALLDPTYDRWRKRKHPQTTDFTYTAADSIRGDAFPQLGASEGTGALSTLQWARAYILVHADTARTEIDMLEANSKFFRTLVVVFGFASAHFLLRQQDLLLAAAAATAALLSFWRYCDQRWKMTRLTYLTTVVLNAAKPASQR